MPFVSIETPSIQLGLLHALTEAHAFPAVSYYFNLDLAAQLGVRLYEALCQHRGHMFGDWLFSTAAFGKRAPDPHHKLLERYGDDLHRLLAPYGYGLAEIVGLRDSRLPAFLDELAESIPWSRYRVVGFSSTFQQNTASFGLAARIKAVAPDTITVFGGANFEWPMGIEWIEHVDCIDFAVIGEGDVAFPQLLEALHAGHDLAAVPGVVTRQSVQVGSARQSQPPTDLESLPVPRYDDFFERAETLGLLPAAQRRRVNLPFESSRGCWWGEKHHCVFCGLNGTMMSHRTKSPKKVLNELAELSAKYRSCDFEAVDNILSPSFLDELFRPVQERELDYRFFYEVKANLSRDAIRNLKRGGVWKLQPGIESLSSPVLKLMRKGVSAAQNVNTLRWALYYGVRVGWNLLCGFPGERQEYYNDQLALLPWLIHLEPPGGAGRIWLERFSPLFMDRVSFGVNSVVPEASYSYVYPSEVDLMRAAYFFDYTVEGALPEDAYSDTFAAVSRWQGAWREATRPRLEFWRSQRFVQIEDARYPDTPGTFTLHEPLASIYLACSERPHTVNGLVRKLGIREPEARLTDALAGLCERGVMMNDGGRYLSLAIPSTSGR